jgi:hypothetical protein
MAKLHLFRTLPANDTAEVASPPATALTGTVLELVLTALLFGLVSLARGVGCTGKDVVDVTDPTDPTDDTEEANDLDELLFLIPFLRLSPIPSPPPKQLKSTR